MIFFIQHFILSQMDAIQEGLHWSFSIVVFPGMGSVVVILFKPKIQIFLQLFQGFVDLLPEGDCIELVLNGPMEAFADPIGLRRSGLGLGIIDVLQAK